MVMRYVHLAPGYLSDEVKKLDTFSLERRTNGKARKGQRAPERRRSRAKVVKFSKKSGSSGWTRTSNPPVNSLMPVRYLVDSSCL
jgi:hypothetical protein